LAFAEGVVQASSEPMAVVDADLRVKSANHRFVQLFSMSTDGFRGRGLTEVTRPGPGLERLRELARGDGESPETAVTLELQLANGSREPMRMSARAFAAPDAADTRVVLLTAEVPNPES